MGGAALRKGDFVLSMDNALGRGKFQSRSGDVASVEYFDPGADGQSEFHLEEVPFGSLRRTRVPKNARVWLKQHGAWRAVRVAVQPSEPGEDYGVVLAGGEPVQVPEAALYVRWERPVADPTYLLSHRVFDHARTHAARHRFLGTMLAQRSACQEMTGILSSVVALHEHQVDVARRVLSDPVQRYVLADEVGLGKTIEAGFIIRQVLIDNPTAKICVLVPRSIGRQWERELRTKFLVDQFPMSELIIRLHDAPEHWPTDDHQDLLVVDEAHHLTTLPDRPGTATESYDRLRRLALDAERVLLLSATPVRSNEQNFLAMLHLLDPDLYSLSDLEGFRRRVENRDELALAVYNLRPELPPFLIPGKVEQLRNLYPDDEFLDGLLGPLAESVDAEESVRAKAIAAVRTHLSETYRLHRRLLRNRREGHILEEFPVRNRTHRAGDWIIAAPDERHSALADWFDELRLALLDLASQGTEEVTEVFRLVAERAAAHPVALRSVADAWSGNDLPEGEPELLGALANWLPADDLLSRLQTLLERNAEPDALDAIVNWLHAAAGGALVGERGPKIVAFSSFSAVADEFAARYQAAWGEHRVARHLTRMDPEEQQAELDRFRTEPLCGVLVCDPSAEEGRNLQFADVIAHLDIPWSTNRLEQRIGRLDRFGVGRSSRPVESVVFVGATENDLARRWTDFVDEAFAVFATSTASLQYVIEDIEAGVLAGVLEHGAAHLDGLATTLREQVSDERAAIEAQDALDSLEETDERKAFFDALQSVDRAWANAQDAANAWVVRQVNFWRMKDPDDSSRRKFTVNTYQPPLIDLTDLPALRPELLDQWGSHSRATAQHHEGDRLLVAGDPFLDAITRHTETDDRGLAYAMFRLIRTPLPAPLPILRFDFLVAPDTYAAEQLAGSSEAKAALRRRADEFLVPEFHTVWLDDTAASLPPQVSALAGKRFDQDAGDRDLSGELRGWLDGILDRLDWDQICTAARAAAEQVLRSSDEHSQRIAAAAQSAEIRFATENYQLELRAKGDPRRAEALEQYRAQTAALLDGLVEPKVELTSCGLVVLGNTPP